MQGDAAWANERRFPHAVGGPDLSGIPARYRARPCNARSAAVRHLEDASSAGDRSIIVDAVSGTFPMHSASYVAEWAPGGPLLSGASRSSPGHFHRYCDTPPVLVDGSVTVSDDEHGAGAAVEDDAQVGAAIALRRDPGISGSATPSGRSATSA